MALSLAILNTNAETLTFAGLNYNILSEEDKTVEVGLNTTIVDDAYVPASFSYDGKEYKVVGVGDNAFNNNYLMTGITIDEGIEYIGEHAFEDCDRLADVNLPSSLKKIGSAAFYNCISLYSIYIPENVESMEMYTFVNCSALEFVELPSSLKAIPIFAFGNCLMIKDLELPEGLETIMFNAFNGCTMLTNLTLPSTLKKIEGDAFSSCTNIKNVVCKSTTPPAAALNCFSSVIFKECTLTFPEEAYDAYSTTAPWNNFYNLAEVSSVVSDSNDMVTVAGNVLKACTDVVVYDVSGAVMAELHAGEAITPAPGVYIVSDGKSSCKIIIKSL